MTNDEGGSITPEIRIKQLEERLVEESDRLEKLYVAYRKVEQELEEKNASAFKNWKNTASTPNVASTPNIA